MQVFEAPEVVTQQKVSVSCARKKKKQSFHGDWPLKPQRALSETMYHSATVQTAAEIQLHQQLASGFT